MPGSRFSLRGGQFQFVKHGGGIVGDEFLPNLLTMILFLPLGPMEVSKIEAISRTASTFLIMAPSALEKEEYPCLNKPEFGACGNFNDIGGQ